MKEKLKNLIKINLEFNISSAQLSPSMLRNKFFVHNFVQPYPGWVGSRGAKTHALHIISVVSRQIIVVLKSEVVSI